MSTLPTVDPQQDASALGSTAPGARPPFVVCVPTLTNDALIGLVHLFADIFPGDPVLIASPDQAEDQPTTEAGPRLVPYPVQRTESEWVLNAADYTAAARLVQERGATGAIVLGTEAPSLSAQAILDMRRTLDAGIDLVIPRYRTGPHEGLVNSSLLYPLTRALFGPDIRFPLPLDAALSARMLTRLGPAASRTASQVDDGLIWPVAEAAVAGYSVRQSEGGERTIPRPQEADLNVLFPAVTASLFTDLEAKAAFWQRARTVPAPRPHTPAAVTVTPESLDEIRPLVDGFRLAFTNLREIWSLVLPPQSLLSLKKLSVTPVESFSFPPSLWARIAYDFALAFHLRTLNRGHLLGALTPLYLAWVAGFLRETSGTSDANPRLVESTASAFEQEKPYLVSRWRWPDRFNP